MTFVPNTPATDNVRALTAAATVNAGDLAEFTVSAVTVATLNVMPVGQRCRIRNQEASTANVTITPPSGASLNGTANATFAVVPGAEYDVEQDATGSYRIV